MSIMEQSSENNIICRRKHHRRKNLDKYAIVKKTYRESLHYDIRIIYIQMEVAVYTKNVSNSLHCETLIFKFVDENY